MEEISIQCVNTDAHDGHNSWEYLNDETEEWHHTVINILASIKLSSKNA